MVYNNFDYKNFKECVKKQKPWENIFSNYCFNHNIVSKRTGYEFDKTTHHPKSPDFFNKKLS